MTSATSTPGIATPVTSTPNSRPGTPLSTPPTTTLADKPQDDSSKLRLFVSLLKKFIGVPDISAVRFSLPAQLIEPIPNLEFTQYIDRPDVFAGIGKSDDEVGRMLEVLRFWFTKDLKYIKGKPIKPYNSVLGEFFRCNWEVNTDAPAIETPKKAPPQPPPDPMAPHDNATPVRVSYITEQTSHHPPISAYYVDCPERGLHAQGYDHINAKFTGSAVRVTSGNLNKGVFVTLTKRGDEEYRLTHPAAYLSGLLKGSLYISVSDQCYVLCPKTKLKVILSYEESSWSFRSSNKVRGVIYKYDPQNDKYQKLDDVPDKEVLVRLEGSWQEQIYYWFSTGDAKADKKGPPANKQLLIDLTPLMPVPKICPPPDEQLSNESRKFWTDLTAALTERRYNDANKVKQDIEQRQRDKAAERQEKKTIWKPRFFTEATEEGGQPHLSEEGQLLLAGMQKKDFKLKESEVLAA